MEVTKNMSLCVETSNVLTPSMGTSVSSVPLLEESTGLNTQSTISTIANQATIGTNILQAPITAIQSNHEKIEQHLPPSKSIAKLVVANHATANNCSTVLQKVNSPLNITVLNPSGPLTVVKTLCVTSGVSSTPQFTLVNSTPLNVTNTMGKSPTFTLLNAPVTVVKAISATHPQAVEKIVSTDLCNIGNNQSNTAPQATSITENRGHNVFVKNTYPDSTIPDTTHNHKILTANNFHPANVIGNTNTQTRTANGQKNKLKVLSNIVMPGTSQAVNNNVLLNKSNTQRFVSRQKAMGPNGAQAKYINKPSSNNSGKHNLNSLPVKLMQDKSPTRMFYPTQKNNVKTIPSINSYMQKTQQTAIKTVPSQSKPVPGQVQRTGSGLRTIPPQRPHKISNKTNYIGKHAVQAQKMRQTHGKVKGIKMSTNVPYNVHAPLMPDKQLTELTFNQALTAQILETLSSNSTPSHGNRYEILPARYDNAFSCPEPKQTLESPKPSEDKSKSGLDALSLICQAVLLDHNYNARLPPDSPTRPPPSNVLPLQVNGITTGSVYSPNITKRRSLSVPNTISSTSSLSSISITTTANSFNNIQDDDAASDISDTSDRKHETEGEETDTAPEAEAVNNEAIDGSYGDYVTRCICDFIHDDGYMVECDKCKVWQHVQCVVKNRQIPEEYLCEVCDPSKPIDRQKARQVQQQWLKDRQFLDPKLKKDKMKEMFKPKEVISDTDSSDGEHIGQNSSGTKRNAANRRRNDSHLKQNVAKQRRDAAKEVVQRRQKRRERKIVRKKNKAQVKSNSDDENHDTWSSNLPQLRQWIEKYEEAVTNHYSPELRARISSIRVNGAHSDLSMQFDSSVHKCRVHTQPLTEIKYLVSTVNVLPNTPVIELRGKYMLSTQHRNSGGNLNTRQHAQRPGPFLFFYRLHKDNTEVCVDTRTYGNAARFVRRSCRPNSELRHCIEKGVLHLYIVTIVNIEKNCELTIKHESHDLAAIGTTQIACACGNLEECLVNKSTVKKNGETSESFFFSNLRKRRGRRTLSTHPAKWEQPKTIKEDPCNITSPSLPSVIPKVDSPVKLKVEKDDIKIEVEPEPEIKMEVDDIKIEETKVENIQAAIKEELVSIKKEEIFEERTVTPTQELMKDTIKQEEVESSSPTPVSTRRSSNYKSDREDDKSYDLKEEKIKCKKLSREERKLEAILRAIEKMEKAESRKQEHQAKQAAHRRESEPGPNNIKDDDKSEPKVKRRRRKGRARTVSQSTRRNRLNSTDSYMTSGDEILLSPNDIQQTGNKSCVGANKIDISIEQVENNKAAVGLLLALSNGDNKQEKSPPRESSDSNSNSAHSSPETPLSSACLLVQAAVEPLEPGGFKFPKTKKGLMNEWLNKVPDPIQSASSISPNSLTPQISNNELDINNFYSTPTKNLAALAQAAVYCGVNNNHQPRGNAKKRWLRQAISEDHSCDSPSSRPESPPLSDMVAPPKKRRLPRESLSNEASPPTTPTTKIPSLGLTESEIDRSNQQEGCVEIVCSMLDGDSPTQTLESESVLKERAAKMKQEFSISTTLNLSLPPAELSSPLSTVMDPRLSRDSRIFSSNSDLIGTVEKTLSILGLENAKQDDPEPQLPKRKVKLSISEYRQRKMLSYSDKNEEHEMESSNTLEENNSVESFKGAATPTRRVRSNSTSSSTSLSSSDDEFNLNDVPVKAPVFNSEPTELEREREISSLRLKKVFGLSVEEARPAIDVKNILNLELESKAKTIPLPSPSFPIPGSRDITNKTSVSPRASSPTSNFSLSAALPHTSADTSHTSVSQEIENEFTTNKDLLKKDDDLKEEKENKRVSSNLFYVPDEEETEEVHKDPETVFEEPESISYVPPFNNPIYPNESFTAYTSSMDDDARYEGRNPSPPPDL